MGGAGVAALLGGRMTRDLPTAEAAACLTLNPAMEEGPFFIDEKLNRSDVRSDPGTGVVQAGVLLTLAITVQNQSSGSCGPLTGAYVDLWQASAEGVYSDEAQENTSGQKFLRGYQITDDNGLVQFATIYPGWYSGRTVHIHLRVRTYSGSTVLGSFETQTFFDDSVTDVVYGQAPYNTRGTRDTMNATDRFYNGASDGNLNLLALTKTSSGYSASLNLAVSMATPAASAPAVATSGVTNAASGMQGIAPGSWISIYGSNLAAATSTLTSTDIVNNAIPTKLSGVSVQIDGNAAYMDYVSPTQINVLSPADANAGSVAVTVSNSAGTSTAVSATLQAMLPGLFTLSNYVHAVRPSDGVVVNGTGNSESGYTTVAAAKAGDVLELYGTGFGPTTPSTAPGLVFTGAYPTTNAVTVTIGGVSATVSFAGLVGAGLYQINVEVPAGLSSGDYPVVASVSASKTLLNALLKIAS